MGKRSRLWRAWRDALRTPSLCPCSVHKSSRFTLSQSNDETEAEFSGANIDAVPVPLQSDDALGCCGTLLE